ncbi:MAG: hypothetical protein ACLRS8_01760 [Parabacteroides merdae]
MTVSAEVLAGMYDASLDKLLPFSWSFSLKDMFICMLLVFLKGQHSQTAAGTKQEIGKD